MHIPYLHVYKTNACFFSSEEFSAHTPNVNCLALGHKSGRVLVTGGDDKKVNLWAVGKQNCIMVTKWHDICLPYHKIVWHAYFAYCILIFIKYVNTGVQQLTDATKIPYFSLLEFKRSHHSHRVCTLWPNRRFGVCWFTDGCIENLGFGACQTSADVDGAQIRHTLHGLSSLRWVTGIRKSGHCDQVVGHSKEGLYLYLQRA